MILDKVSCPSCSFTGSPRQLHAHFTIAHTEWVSFDKAGSKWTYSVTCPVCKEGYAQPIKAGRVGEEFLESYQDEIRAVATDVLLNHYLGEHVLDPDPESGQNNDGRP